MEVNLNKVNKDSEMCEHGNFINTCAVCSVPKLRIENSNAEEQEKQVTRVITARGSVYEYLPDGRTQRYKKATAELNEPQDTLTFIPPWEQVKNEAIKRFPSVFSGIESQTQYEQVLLTYAQIPGHTIRVVNREGQELKTNSDTREAGTVFLQFIDNNNPNNNFYLPVSVDPKVGYLTFDTRKYKNQEGETMRERHIGNAVSEIFYTDN